MASLVVARYEAIQKSHDWCGEKERMKDLKEWAGVR